jgi:hypothetical protein
MDHYNDCFKVYDQLERIVNTYFPKYKIKVKLSKYEKKIMHLFEKRRTMSIAEIMSSIRNRVSIFGIYNSASKQKEVILNLQDQIKDLQNDLQVERSMMNQMENQI